MVRTYDQSSEWYLGSYLLDSCIDIVFLAVPCRQRQEVLAGRRVLCIAKQKILPKEQWKKKQNQLVSIQIEVRLQVTSEIKTFVGDPQSRRRWRSDSDTTIPGGSLSSPCGFLETFTIGKYGVFGQETMHFLWNETESFRTACNWCTPEVAFEVVVFLNGAHSLAAMLLSLELESTAQLLLQGSMPSWSCMGYS
jgi:hypothetical protein